MCRMCSKCGLIILIKSLNLQKLESLHRSRINVMPVSVALPVSPSALYSTALFVHCQTRRKVCLSLHSNICMSANWWRGFTLWEPMSGQESLTHTQPTSVHSVVWNGTRWQEDEEKNNSPHLAVGYVCTFILQNFCRVKKNLYKTCQCTRVYIVDKAMKCAARGSYAFCSNGTKI